MSSFLMLAPESVSAQDAESILQSWLTAQQTALGGRAYVGFEEIAELEIEAAFGPRRLRRVSRIEIGPEGLRRTLIEADGGKPARRPHDRRRMPPPIRPDLQDAVDALLIPGGATWNLRATEYTQREEFEGRSLLAVLLVPADSSSAIERATAWFDEATVRLVRVRAVLAAPDAGTMLSEIHYDRIAGIDMAVTRALEGSFRMRRRTRTFTIVVREDSRFGQVAFEPPAPPPPR